MVSTEAYGTWPSPIDAALTAAQDGKPEFVGTVGDEVWWTEPRPAEGGRRALVRRRADGATGSVLPAPWNPRSRVIEYGGMPWAGAPRQEGGPLVVFVHFPDQRLYAYAPDGPDEPWPLTPVSDIGGGLRWVDPQLQLAHGEVWCVLEEFTGESPTDVRRVIAAVPLDGSAAADRGAVRELTDDRNRFVTGPRLSHDGSRVAWIAWDHPQMPWDGTVVKMADVTADGTFTGVRPLVGDVDESVVQVEWDRDGSLLFVSDVGGWWELQRIRPDVVADAVVPTSRLCAVRNEEFGGPLWRIGLRWFQLLDNGLVAVIHGRGTTALGVLDPETGELVDAVGPWTAWAETLAVQDTRVIGIAASPHTSYEVVELDTATGHTRTIGAPHEDAVDPAYHPEPVIRTFTGPGGREIHAHVYPRVTPTARAPRANCRPTSSGRTAVPPAAPRSCSTWRSPTSPPGESVWPRSTTAVRPATAAPTANGSARSGASSTWRTARPSRWAWPRRVRPTGPGWRSGAEAPGLDHRGFPHPDRRVRLRGDQLPDPRPGGLGDR